jgi:hypothetical protein
MTLASKNRINPSEHGQSGDAWQVVKGGELPGGTFNY